MIFVKELGDRILSEKLNGITAEILRESPPKERSFYRYCEKYGDEDEDVREYTVFCTGGYVLKKTSANENEEYIYGHYLSGGSFAVPKYYGGLQRDGEGWILLSLAERLAEELLS